MGAFKKKQINEQRRRIKSQINIGVQLARVSPVSSFLLLSTTLARTGVFDYMKAADWKYNTVRRNKKHHNDEYYRRVDKYRDKYNVVEFGKMVWQTGEMPDMTGLPSVNYQDVSLTQTMAFARTDLVLLILESLAIFMAAFYLFTRKSDI
jgi:hypothetical protein